MSSTKEATLISLAMLKVHIDNNQDYLEYLRPFIKHVLYKHKPSSISDQSVTDLIKNEFGLEIPCRAVQIVLKRISRTGIIEKSGGIYYIKKDINDPGIDSRKAEAHRHISAILADFKAYWKREISKELSENEAIDAIIEYLSEFSIPYLKTYLRGTALPELDQKKSQNLVLVSKYLLELLNKNPQRFESFMVLMEGHMLANGILCPDLHSAPKSYKNLTFFLDTPLLIARLGFEGEQKKKSIAELIELLRKLDGTVVTFSHLKNELVTVIKGVSDKLDSYQGHGAIIQEARRRGKTKSDFLLSLGKIDDNLVEAGIGVIPTPNYTTEHQKISEEAFESLLDDEIRYLNPHAKINDINSVRSIYALRQGQSPSSVEKSKAILVTNNTDFSKAAYEYGKKFEETREVSSVITDFSIANMAWLKAPMGAPSLPRKEVIAYSYAALCPSRDLLNKFLAQIELLKEQGNITERDHQFLRSNYFLDDELMTLTLGEENALTAESIYEMSKRLTEEIRKEESQLLKHEKDSHLQTRAKFETLKNERESLREKTYWGCRKKARRYKCALYIFLTFIVIVGLGVSRGIKSQHPIAGDILSVIAVGFLIIGFLNVEIGTTVKDLAGKFENKILKMCIKRQEKFFGFKIEKNEDLI